MQKKKASAKKGMAVNKATNGAGKVDNNQGGTTNAKGYKLELDAAAGVYPTST